MEALNCSFLQCVTLSSCLDLLLLQIMLCVWPRGGYLKTKFNVSSSLIKRQTLQDANCGCDKPPCMLGRVPASSVNLRSSEREH